MTKVEDKVALYKMCKLEIKQTNKMGKAMGLDEY